MMKSKTKAQAQSPSKAQTQDESKRVKELIKRLQAYYPEAKCSLDFQNPFELLVSTILSAQCTDERVNKVTADLFRKYRSVHDYANAATSELERDIHSTGFFRNKAKNIQASARRIIEDYKGEVPHTMDELLTLPGVARKTANVVLGNGFGIASGVVVDTHVKRISYRLGLTGHKDPVKIEKDLIEKIPKSEWIEFPHLLIHHGRRICKPRPLCGNCPVADLCPSKE